MDVSGKKVVITGRFSKLSQKEIQLALEERGAKVTGSVSGKTELLIAGESAGAKRKKAESLGILVVSEKELMAILAQEVTAMTEPQAKPKVSIPAAYAGKQFEFLKDQNILLTGALTNFKRAEVKALIEASGGKVVSSIGKAGIVICGSKWGNKLHPAIDAGVDIWTEDLFLLYLEGRVGLP